MKLPKIGLLKYYDGSLDRNVHMYNLVKYKEIEKLDDTTHKGRFMTRIFVKFFHQGYHIGPKIDIIKKCKPFFEPRYPYYIRIYQGYFDDGIRLPLSELTVHILN